MSPQASFILTTSTSLDRLHGIIRQAVWLYTTAMSYLGLLQSSTSLSLTSPTLQSTAKKSLPISVEAILQRSTPFLEDLTQSFRVVPGCGQTGWSSTATLTPTQKTPSRMFSRALSIFGRTAPVSASNSSLLAATLKELQVL